VRFPVFDHELKFTLSPQIALQKHFKMKRDYFLKRLHEMHLDVTIPPVATFYIWLSLESLPPPLNNGLVNPLQLCLGALTNKLLSLDVLRGIAEGKDHRSPGNILRHQSGAQKEFVPFAVPSFHPNRMFLTFLLLFLRLLMMMVAVLRTASRGLGERFFSFILYFRKAEN
jgi:hypothetical protein